MIQPTLALNFGRTKQLDRRVNFTRSSTGVYTGFDGILRYAGIDEPRFEHDASGNSLGLLIEPQRTNLVAYSQDFDNAYWQKTIVIVSADSTMAPDGTTTADKIIPTVDNTYHQASQVTTLATDGTDIAAFSVYLKAGEYTKTSVRLGRATTQTALVDLSAGEFIYVYSSVVDSSLTDVGGGWLRVFIRTDMSTLVGIQYAVIQPLDAAGNVTFAGDGTSGIYAWGAQVEVGATPSTYIPTTTAAVTRTADSAEISGDPFASWINTEGTLLAKYRDAGWLYNDTPPTDSLDLTKYIDDYSTSAAGDVIERVLFYPRTLTAAQRGKIML